MTITTTLMSSTSIRCANTFTQKESLERYHSFNITSVAENKTPSFFLAVSAVTPSILTDGNFVQNNHGMITGLKVRILPNDGSTLPTGLIEGNDYFVIRTTGNTFKLATTQELAIAGTALTYTAAGTGTLQVNPYALNANYFLQASNDGKSWVDIPGASFNATQPNPSFFYEALDVQHAFIRGRLEIEAGQVAISSVFYSRL